MKVWTNIKRTPATMAGWMLAGAAGFAGIGLANGSNSVGEFLVSTVAGCVIAIVLRAVAVSARSRKTA